MQTQTILDRINTLPRIKLARLNTPFEEMPRLRAAIADSMDADPNANKCAVPQLFIKRDDTTGFAFGGNKARHMEFLFAHLIDRGIDTIVNINHYDSNNARLVSAACAKTGMKCHWVAFDMLDKPITGNLLLGHLAGAVIHRVPAEHSRSVAEKLLAEETKNGRNATILSDNPFFDIAGMIGFLETGAELDTQIANVIPATFLPGPTAKGTREPKRPTTDSRGSLTSSRRRPGPTGEGRPTRRSPIPPPPLAGEDSGGGPATPPSACGASADAPSLASDSTHATPQNPGPLPPPHKNTTHPTPTKPPTSNVPPASPNSSTSTPPSSLATSTPSPDTADATASPPKPPSKPSTYVAKTEGIILDPNYTGKSMSALIGEIRTRQPGPRNPHQSSSTPAANPKPSRSPNSLWDWEG